MGDDATVHVPPEGLEGPEVVPGHLADRVDRILIPESRLRSRVRDLARGIRERRGGEALTLVVILDGACTFGADLGRELHRAGLRDLRFAYVKARTYGDSLGRDGIEERPVRLLLEPDHVSHRDVLLVDDIVDQGFTLSRVATAIRERGPRSLALCALLSKRLDHPAPRVGERRRALEIDFLGFSVPDRWVAGYGIDAAGDFRELPYVVAVNEEFYTGRSGPEPGRS